VAASITRRIVCAGAIAGFSALALIVNPAIGSAAVTGSSTGTSIELRAGTYAVITQ
jgi:hypothetical protein